MTTPRTVALVESATQLLNVVEWAAATGDEAARLRVAVLLPRDVHSRNQIVRVAEIARGTGLDVRRIDIRAAGVSGVLGAARLVRDLPRADCLVIGDPFSGLIQTLLPMARAERVVVVDDGTATWEFAACVNAGRPLTRWRLPEPTGSRRAHRAARATRALSPSIARDIAVFTCLADATPVGAQRLVNRYAWTRRWHSPRLQAGEVDLVGASLVETGVIDRGAYLDAVRSLTSRSRSVRYLAHRRESDNRLAEIATLPGVRVVRPELPVELALRAGPVAHRVITFPSTAAHTLPVVLGDLDVVLEGRRVESSWFTAASTPHAREFVARIAADAPLRPVLEIA